MSQLSSNIGKLNGVYLEEGVRTGEHAHSRYFNETIMSQAKGNAELHAVSGARPIDLYDRVDLIPFGKIEEFFEKSLGG